MSKKYATLDSSGYRNSQSQNNFQQPEPEPQPKPSAVKYVQSLNDRRKMIGENKVVCIYNYADWCTPCKSFSPIYDELSTKFRNITFLKENHSDKFGDYPVQITGVPCFHFYVNGGFQNRMTVVGADLKQLENNLNFLVSKV